MDAHIAACCGPCVTVWNPRASSADNVVLNIKGNGDISTVVWMSNAKVLAAGGEEGVVRFYGTKGNNSSPVATCPKDRDTSALRNPITAISANHTGNHMAYGSRTGDLLVASLASLETRVVHRGVGGAITSIATTKALNIAASGLNGKVFLMADLKENSSLTELSCKDSQPKCSLSASSVDDRLACGSYAGGICIWDSASGLVRNYVQHQDSGAVHVSFLPTSADSLVAAGSSSRCKVWDIRNESKCSLAFGLQRPATGVSCCGDGCHVAIGDEDGIVWVYDLRATAVAQMRLPCGADAPVGHVTWYVRSAQPAGSSHARTSSGAQRSAERTSSGSRARTDSDVSADDSARISGGQNPLRAGQRKSDGGAPSVADVPKTTFSDLGEGSSAAVAAEETRSSAARASASVRDDRAQRSLSSAPAPAVGPLQARAQQRAASSKGDAAIEAAGVSTQPTPGTQDRPVSAALSMDAVPTPAVNTHQLKEYIDKSVEQMKQVITNLHLDLLRQFQAQQEDLLVVTNHLTERLDGLAADVKGIRAALDARNKQEQAANWL